LEEKPIHQELGYGYWRRNGKEINCSRNRKIRKKTHVLFWATVFFFFPGLDALHAVKFKFSNMISNFYIYALEDVKEKIHFL
jgi:hypothetical protein